MNKEYTTPASAGLAPSKWVANLSNKTPKERNKIQNPMDPIQLPGSHANAAKRMTVPRTRSKKIPNLKYLDPTTIVET
jgi:hypothetical protein